MYWLKKSGLEEQTQIMTIRVMEDGSDIHQTMNWRVSAYLQLLPFRITNTFVLVDGSQTRQVGFVGSTSPLL